MLWPQLQQQVSEPSLRLLWHCFVAWNPIGRLSLCLYRPPCNIDIDLLMFLEEHLGDYFTSFAGAQMIFWNQMEATETKSLLHHQAIGFRRTCTSIPMKSFSAHDPMENCSGLARDHMAQWVLTPLCISLPPHTCVYDLNLKSHELARQFSHNPLLPSLLCPFASSSIPDKVTTHQSTRLTQTASIWLLDCNLLNNHTVHNLARSLQLNWTTSVTEASCNFKIIDITQSRLEEYLLWC